MNAWAWIIGVVLLVGVGGGVYFYQSKPPEKAQVFTEITPTPAAVDTAPVEDQKIMTSPSTPSALGATTAKPKNYSAAPSMTIDMNKSYTAIMVTNKGTMTIQLYPKDAPKTVNNFVFLSREGFYADTIFHRIIKGFMIQGGDPQGTGMGGPGYKFDDEPVTREYTKGTIAMANAGPNTNGSQFFIMHADYPLPKNYVIFGAIDSADASSLVTLDAIGQTPVTTSGGGEQSKPMETVTVKSVTIVEK